ncbi:MAG: dehydrogenase [Rhodospirillaceae bacterium]|nr:dehydrogenase [Rhodospirillaceae bacterium]
MAAGEKMPVIAFFWPEEDFRLSGVQPPEGYEMRFARGGDRAAMEAAVTGADYLVAASGFGQIDRPLLERAPDLRLVQLTGAGYDTVDRAYCAERGIPACYCPGMNAPSVAQLAVLFALTLRRGHVRLEGGGREAWVAARQGNLPGRELTGRVGIVGYGKIGRCAAQIFAGFGVEVVRLERKGQDDPNVPALALDELLSTSDVVVVTLPATAETRGLIDARRVGLLKDDAVLVNVARGGIVDDAAVAAALAAGRLGGVGFDVFDEEPMRTDHPFLALPEDARKRLILSPHIAGQAIDAKARAFRFALDNVARVARGEEPQGRVPAL